MHSLYCCTDEQQHYMYLDSGSTSTVEQGLELPHTESMWIHGVDDVAVVGNSQQSKDLNRMKVVVVVVVVAESQKPSNLKSFVEHQDDDGGKHQVLVQP